MSMTKKGTGKTSGGSADAEAQEPVVTELDFLREMVRKTVESRNEIWDVGVAPSKTASGSYGGTFLPADISIPEYISLVDNRGEIVNVSIKKVGEQLSKVVEAITNIAEDAANKANGIATKVGKVPFELEEVTVSLAVKIQAGVVVAGIEGDTNLELKFVRQRPSGGATT